MVFFIVRGSGVCVVIVLLRFFWFIFGWRSDWFGRWMWFFINVYGFIYICMNCFMMIFLFWFWFWFRFWFRIEVVFRKYVLVNWFFDMEKWIWGCRNWYKFFGIWVEFWNLFFCNISFIVFIFMKVVIVFCSFML